MFNQNKETETSTNERIPKTNGRSMKYCNTFNCYSLKIFHPFWLVKATRIIHHNQMLLTKFRKNFVMFNRWRQNCSPLQIIEPLIEKPRPGDEVVSFLVSGKTKSSFSPLRVLCVKHENPTIYCSSVETNQVPGNPAKSWDDVNLYQKVQDLLQYHG